MSAAQTAKEEAPLRVVIHRQGTASITAAQVARLLGHTPVEKASGWPQRLQLTEEQVQHARRAAADHPYYVDNKKVDVLPATIWADLLPKIAAEEVAAEEVAAAVEVEAEGPAEVSSTAEEDASDGASAEAAEDPEPAAAAGEGAATALVTDDAAGGEEADEQDEPAADAQSAASDAPAAEPEEAAPGRELSPSLLAALSPGLAEGHARVEEKIQAVALLRTKLAEREAALDEDGLSDVQAENIKAQMEVIEGELDRAIDAVEPAQEAFIARAKELAKQVPAERRARYGAALVNLSAAVDAALDANGAASIRYPFVAASTLTGGPGALKDELKEAAKASASDYVYEKTGSRMKLGKMKVDLTLQDGTVGLTLNGLSPEQVGKVEMDELVSETILRTQLFAGKAWSLVSDAGDTGRQLEYQEGLLDSILDGFESSGWKRVAAASVDGPGIDISASATAAIGAIFN